MAGFSESVNNASAGASHSSGRLGVLVIQPAGGGRPSVALAASRAGAVGALDLRFAVQAARDAIDVLARAGGGGGWGLILDDGATVLDDLPSAPDVVVLTGARASGDALSSTIAEVHRLGAGAFVQALSVEDAVAAQDAGADVVVATGHEAGAWVGDEGSFVLVQRCVARLDVPVWAHGGIGLHTAAAAVVAGAAGVVLDSQVLLARESPLPEAVRRHIAAMDGSETVCLGRSFGSAFRLLARPGLDGAEQIQRVARDLETDEQTLDTPARWRAELRARVAFDGRPGAVLPVGQDGAFAAGLARRHVTVGGIVAALRDAAREQAAAARAHNPFAPGSALAALHGTEHPIVQGPMTRVSDRAEFAAAVAEAGALPFLALALLRGPEVAALLEHTRDALGERAVGRRHSRLRPRRAAVRAARGRPRRHARPSPSSPAGGPTRPARSRTTGRSPTCTFRRPRCCVCPQGRRPAVRVRRPRVRRPRRAAHELRPVGVDGAGPPRGGPGGTGRGVPVLFAGGVHDGLSAAMVAAIAAPLTARGIKVGVLMGTAYLFTEEAVTHGAINDASSGRRWPAPARCCSRAARATRRAACPRRSSRTSPPSAGACSPRTAAGPAP